MSAPNRDLGPCVVVWDPDGDNVEFSKTFGGVFFRYEELRASVKRDQAGETDVDEVTIGATNPELEVPLTQEEIANLEKCFAHASAGANYLKVSNPVGAAVLADAKEVIVKPIVNGVVSTTNTEWLHIHRAFPRITMEQAYDNSGQRTNKVIFKGFPDDTSGQVGEMWRYGPAS
ncbi:MAG: hypothetical protein ACTSPV_00670 [Candidatus Hodarchaeales archaeon]